MSSTFSGFVHPAAEESEPDLELSSSGVSWGAVIGGAFVAAAFYLILLALGSGLGLSAVSPWAGVGASASTLGMAAVGWMLFMHVVASGLGGYLTGRLRTKWVRFHGDEVYFRDTANGFLSWAVAMVISVTLLTSAASSMLGRVAQGGTSSVGTAVADRSDYFVDSLFRSTLPQGNSIRDLPIRAEAGRVFANLLIRDEAVDRTYVASIVAMQTGLTQQEAEARVNDTITRAKQAADAVRQTTGRFLLWSFLALIMGAFAASYAATVGGRQRDHLQAV